MIASRFGSSNALGDHVPPLPCLCCCPGRIYCGCEAFASEDSLTGWTALRARGSGSFSSPSGSHRLRQLRTTFRCKVEFSLHLFGSARLFHGSGRFLAGFPTRCGRLCCSKLLFQLGEFVPTFLQPSFEPADPFPETFKVFHIRKESPRRLLMRMTEILRKSQNLGNVTLFLAVVQHQLRPICVASPIRMRFQRITRVDQNQHDGRFACAWRT